MIATLCEFLSHGCKTALCRCLIDDLAVSTARNTGLALGRHRHLMLFSGDPLPDVHRRSIAIKPSTRPPNAFRTGDALIRLEPGSSFTSTLGYRSRTHAKALTPEFRWGDLGPRTCSHFTSLDAAVRPLTPQQEQGVSVRIADQQSRPIIRERHGSGRDEADTR